VVAVAGAREALVSIIGERAKLVVAAGGREAVGSVTGGVSIEVDDPELLSVPVEGVDVYVTNKAVDGKTLAELAGLPGARGVFLRKITRGATATTIPILRTRSFTAAISSPSSGGPRTLPLPPSCWEPRTGQRMSQTSRLSAPDYGRRTGRCAGVEGGRSAADASTAGGAPHRRARARVVSLDAPVLREDSVAHCVVHELGRLNISSP